jgi:hypothetical protein
VAISVMARILSERKTPARPREAGRRKALGSI